MKNSNLLRLLFIAVLIVSFYSVSISQCELTLTPISIQPESCSGSCDGSLEIEVTGAPPPFMYTIDGGSPQFTFDNTISLTGLCAGIYSIFVTDEMTMQCTGSLDVEIGTNTSPIILSCEPFYESQPGSEDGYAYIFMSNGIPPYDIVWSPPFGTLSIQSPTYYQLNNLPAGDYSVTVTDVAGCTAICNFTIYSCQLNANIMPDGVVCTGESINLSVALENGTPPYSYDWTGPNSFYSVNPSPSLDVEQGTYKVIVIDSDLCFAQDEFNVSGLPEVSLTANAPCEGQDLELSASASGGTGGPYEFVWKKPDGSLVQTSSLSISNASPDDSGNYELTVTDVSGCSKTETLAAVVHAAPIVAPSKTIKLCQGEKLNLNANWAPSTAYEDDPGYEWTGPGGFQSSDANPTVSNISAAQTGSYCVLITNEYGCKKEFCTEVEVVDCNVGTTYAPICKDPCVCTNNCNDSGSSALESVDINEFTLRPPPRNIEDLSRAAKITRPNIPGPPPCECELNTFTGNLYIEVPLFAIPSLGPDLAFSMVYNNTNTSLNHGYGNGWTWNYNLLLEEHGDSMIVRRGDGRADVFILKDSIYIAPVGTFETFKEIAPDEFVLRTKFGKEFHFEDSTHQRLTKIIDRNNNELIITYNDSLATEITDATGRTLKLEYENDLLTTITEGNTPFDRTAHIQYDANGNLRQIKDPLGYTRKYIPDVFRNIIQIIDRNGNIVDVSYNERHALTTLQSTISTMQVEYDTSSKLTILTLPVSDSLQIMNYSFDALGRITTIMGSCCGFDVAYEYDSLNNIVSITDANLNVDYFEYDQKGNVTIHTDPMNKTQTFVWEPDFSQMSGWTDKNGNNSTCEFDSNGNVVQMDEPEDITTTYIWSGTGLLTSATDGNENTTTFEFNINGYQSTVNFPIGSEHSVFDSIGNLKFLVTPNGDSTHFEYDHLDHLIKIIDPLGHSEEMRHDCNGNEIWKKNKRGFATTYVYDAFDRMVKQTQPMGVITEYVYDEKGNLIYMKDPNGNETLYEYDTHNMLVKETNELGDSRSWKYDPNGNLKEEKNYRSFSTYYKYDELNRLTEHIDALGHTTKYEYDSNGNNTKITSPDGVDSDFEYDEKDRLKKEEHAFFESIRVFDKNGNLTEETDANGNPTKYTYDVNNRLLSIEDALGQVITFGYDLNGNPTSETDKNGNVTQIIFDALDRTIVEINAVGDTLHQTYDETGNPLTTTNERGFTTQMAYDSLDRMTKITYPIGEEAMTYDANGNPLSETDAEGRVTTSQFDVLDRLIQTIHADGSTETQVFDENSNTIAVTNEENETTRATYDTLDRLTLTVSPTNDSTSIGYNSMGQQFSISQPTGNVLHTVYDAEGRVISVYDNLGTISLPEYDANGNTTKETDANGNSITQTYDALNRPVITTDANDESTLVTYDANDNLLTTTDRNGKTTTRTYNALNRPITMTDAMGYVTTSAYDEVSNLLSLNDANGNTTAYEYDGNDRLTKESFADNTTKEYIIDMVGNLTQHKDNNGDLTNYNYDTRNRLTIRDYPDTNDDAFTYDLTGRMTTAVNNNATLTFTYDDVGRMLSETLNGKSTAYAYDIPNRTRSLTYPGGKTVVEKMDERERMNSITSNGSEITKWYHDATDQTMSRTYGNGTVSNYRYTATDWVETLHHTNASGIFAGFNNTFDKEGNKQQEIKTHSTDHSELYSYDENYRLTNFQRGDLASNTISFEKTFDYDPLGNRDQVVENGMTTTFATNEMNEYTSVSGSSNPVHDDNGNLTADGIHTYSYDFENRLLRVNNGATATYFYDALGRRIRKVALDIVDFFFDGARVIEERDGNGVTEATYVYGDWIDDILTMDRGGSTYYYHQNNLGSVATLTDASGLVAEHYEYDAYGKVSIYDSTYMPLNSSSIGNPYLFTGRRLDEETGLYYYRARHYDPEHGRFMQRDPLGYEDGMNMFEYVGSNPTNFLDPFGLKGNKKKGVNAQRIVVKLWRSGSDNISIEVKVLNKQNPNKSKKYKIFAYLITHKNGKKVWIISTPMCKLSEKILSAINMKTKKIIGLYDGRIKKKIKDLSQGEKQQKQLEKRQKYYENKKEKNPYLKWKMEGVKKQNKKRKADITRLKLMKRGYEEISGRLICLPKKPEKGKVKKKIKVFDTLEIPNRRERFRKLFKFMLGHYPHGRERLPDPPDFDPFLSKIWTKRQYKIMPP